MKVPRQRGVVLKGNQTLIPQELMFLNFVQVQSLWSDLFRTSETQDNKVSRGETQREGWLMSKAQS